jgi:hypothetical protein
MRNSTVGLGFEMSKARERYLANLYWLAFLITADQEKSARAITSALKDFGGSQGLASNRTRGLLVAASIAEVAFDLRKSAFQTFWKQGLPGADPLPARLWLATLAPEELRQALLNVDAFPRCALLLTVFEHMHLQRAARLLHAGEELVRIGQRIGAIELTRNLAVDQGWVPMLVPPNLRCQGTEMHPQMFR